MFSLVVDHRIFFLSGILFLHFYFLTLSPFRLFVLCCTPYLDSKISCLEELIPRLHWQQLIPGKMWVHFLRRPFISFVFCPCSPNRTIFRYPQCRHLHQMSSLAKVVNFITQINYFYHLLTVRIKSLNNEEATLTEAFEYRQMLYDPGFGSINKVGRHDDIPKLLNTNDNSYFNSRNAMIRTLIRVMTLEQFTKISMTQGHIYGYLMN